MNNINMSPKEEVFFQYIVKKIDKFTEMPPELIKAYFYNIIEVTNNLYKQIFGVNMGETLKLNLNEEIKKILHYPAKKIEKNNKQLNGDEHMQNLIYTLHSKEPENDLEKLTYIFINYKHSTKAYQENKQSIQAFLGVDIDGEFNSLASLKQDEDNIKTLFESIKGQTGIIKKSIMTLLNAFNKATLEQKKLQEQKKQDRKERKQKQQEEDKKKQAVLQKQQDQEQKKKVQKDKKEQKKQERKQKEKAALQKQQDLEQKEDKKKQAVLQTQQDQEQKKKVQKDKKEQKKQERKQKEKAVLQKTQEEQKPQELEQKEFSNLKDLLRQIPIQNSQIPQNLFEKQEELNRLKEWLTQRYKIAEFNSQDVIEGKIPSDDEQNQQENDQTQQSKQVILHTDIEKVLLQQEGQKQPESSNFESNPQLQRQNPQPQEQIIEQQIYPNYNKQQYNDNRKPYNKKGSGNRFIYVPKASQSFQKQ